MTQSNSITAADTNDIVAIVWADGTYTTAEGTFVGGSEEAKAVHQIGRRREQLMAKKTRIVGGVAGTSSGHSTRAASEYSSASESVKQAKAALEI